MHFTEESLAQSSEVWSHVVVVPMRAERKDRVMRLCNSLEAAAACREQVCEAAPKTLIVVVLNSKEGALAKEAERNQILRDYFYQMRFENLDFLFLDHALPERAFDEKGGVGRARRLGADLAARLIQEKRVLDGWIRCTDADAEVPPNYFVGFSPEHAAYIYRFRHVFSEEPEQRSAGILYDAYLRHLRLGMKSAASDFAYHSIGSLIAVRADLYGAVRGFPDCEAGEDFYFLNKIRKMGTIEWGTVSGPVKLEGRISHRVPFGTGRAITKILADGFGACSFYDPRVFQRLGNAIEWLLASKEGDRWQEDPMLSAFLESRKMAPKIRNIAAQCKSDQQWRSRIMQLFDAFEQLKYMHYLREQAYPSLPWQDAVAQSDFLPHEIRQNSGDLPQLQQELLLWDESTPFV